MLLNSHPKKRVVDFYAAVEIAYPRFTYGKKIATLEIHLASLAKFCDGAHDFLPCENDLYNSSSGFQRGDYGAKLPFVIVHKIQNFFRSEDLFKIFRSLPLYFVAGTKLNMEYSRFENRNVTK